MAAITSAAIGLAVGVGTTAASFAQAAQAKKDQRMAELKAEEAMNDARKKLDVNFYESLSVKKEPYELEREALLASGAQAIEAGVESERGAGAVAGRVQMAQNEQQGAIRTSMGKELTDLEKLTAGEESRLRDVNVQLDLEEVAGAQLAAATSQEQYANSIESGLAGVTSTGKTAAEQVSLYPIKKKQAAPVIPTYEYPTNNMPANQYSDYGVLKSPLLNESFKQQQMQNPFGFEDGGVMVVGGEGNDDIALVEAATGNDTGKRVSKGEMIVVSKENVGAIKKAIKAKDKDTVFKVVEAQLKAKPIKKKSVKK